MSSISSAGGSSLTQWLQQISAQSPNGTASAATTASALAGTQDSDGDNDGSGSAPAGAAQGSGRHHGHHGFAAKIESAVTSALSSAPAGSDPNQVIQDALKQLLGGDTTQSSTGTSPIASGGTDSQFQQDLQSALQSSTGNGGFDFAKLFQNFPPGTTVDVRA